MNAHDLTTNAGQRLEGAPQSKRIVLIYAGILTGMAVLVTLINYLLGLQISRTGGLSSLGIRSILSAVQTMLPLIQTVLSLCLALGYVAAMLRIARGQYASPQTLRLGFDRFWVLIRYTLIKGLIFFFIGLTCAYLSTMLFVLTPLSRGLLEALAPLLGGITQLEELVLDESLYAQILPALTPMFVIFFLLFLLMAFPVLMRYRMADYVIIDHPDKGALAALRESRNMMRGNFKKLLKVDLHLWWYYLSVIAAGLLCYGDQLLPLIGIQLPMSETAAYYGFYGLYLAAQFAIYYFLCNHVETTYALAYEAIRPVEQKNNGVVLGNIFDM